MYEKYATKQREIVAKLLEKELNYTDFNSGREVKINMGAEKTPVSYKLSPIDKDTNVLTNADRFRSMSDEEQQKCVRRFWEIEDFADWLKQPAEVTEDA